MQKELYTIIAQGWGLESTLLGRQNICKNYVFKCKRKTYKESGSYNKKIKRSNKKQDWGIAKTLRQETNYSLISISPWNQVLNSIVSKEFYWLSNICRLPLFKHTRDEKVILTAKFLARMSPHAPPQKHFKLLVNMDKDKE